MAVASRTVRGCRAACLSRTCWTPPRTSDPHPTDSGGDPLEPRDRDAGCHAALDGSSRPPTAPGVLSGLRVCLNRRRRGSGAHAPARAPSLRSAQRRHWPSCSAPVPLPPRLFSVPGLHSGATNRHRRRGNAANGGNGTAPRGRDGKPQGGHYADATSVGTPTNGPLSHTYVSTT